MLLLITYSVLLNEAVLTELIFLCDVGSCTTISSLFRDRIVFILMFSSYVQFCHRWSLKNSREKQSLIVYQNISDNSSSTPPTPTPTTTPPQKKILRIKVSRFEKVQLLLLVPNDESASPVFSFLLSGKCYCHNQFSVNYRLYRNHKKLGSTQNSP